MSSIGSRLKEAREQRGLLQSELAKMIGVKSAGVISNWEQDVSKPDANKMVRLCQALSISLSYLLDYYGNEETPSKKDEADEIAERFRALDEHGRGAVRAILNFEHAAAIAERRQSGGERPNLKLVKKRSDGFLNLTVYDQPAAAGLGNYLDDPASHIEQYPANVVPEGTDFGIKISGRSMEPSIPDGATAFVHAQLSIQPGQIGIFRLNGDALCKKLAVDRERGQVRLVSFNKAEFPDDRIIEECDDFQTMALVLGWYPK